MAEIITSGLHHVRLTVTDIARSRAFYEGVLGFQVRAESPGDPADPAVRADPSQLYGGVVYNANGVVLGLRPVAEPSDAFVSERVGLDHISFSVPTRADLDTAAERFAKEGVEHGEVIELTAFGIAILSFTDPDGIHLELSAPL
jgi:glyoxylase I family protein